MNEEITATEVFTFVNNVFNDERSNEYLRELLTILVDSKDDDSPKDIVHKFSLVIGYYQKYCLEQIARQLGRDSGIAISQLHNASIVAQGGT